MNLTKLNRLLLQTLLLPVVALALVSLLLVWQIAKAERAVARIQTADENIATANLIVALVVDEETGIRGYQSTSNEIFLQPYEFAVGPLQDSIARLRTGIAKQGGDQRPIDDLVSAHERWVTAIAEPMIDTVRAGGDTSNSGLNLRGKANIDRVRSILAGIINTQKEQRTRYVDSWQAQVRHTLETVVVLSVVLGLLIGLFARSRLHRVSAAFQGALEGLRQNAQITFESEQRLRATLTSIGEAVVVCDLEGRIELLNTVAEHLTGWSQGEVFHLPVETIFPLIDEITREPIETPFSEVKRLNQRSHPAQQAMLVRRDGEEISVDRSGAPIQERSGQLAGVVMVFRDITQRRRAQAALVASEKLAVAGRLAASIAHEIHNPLDAVVNLLYLMKTATPEESGQFLEMASSELDRVTQISRAMLGMYRESKTPVALDMKKIVDGVLILLDHQVTQAGISLRIDMEEGAIVTGYPAELRQAFTNLLANAVEASQTGATLEVSVHRESTARDGFNRPGVSVVIEDHGEGIPAETLENLFQPFFTTKGEHGTGLGLWVSQGIVHKHGGSITVETGTEPEDHGTTVTVFLPRGEAEFSEHA